MLKKSRPGGRLSEEECRILMKKLVSGLRDLYEFDIVHRDLKLANVLLHFPIFENSAEVHPEVVGLLMLQAEAQGVETEEERLQI
jgi:serine/threonine protein kinase